MEKLDRRRLSMLNGLWSCQGMVAGDEISKEVERIESAFEEMIDSVYGFVKPEIDLSANPFFAASQVYKNKLDTQQVKQEVTQGLFVLEG